jgi:hypothetical protein
VTLYSHPIVERRSRLQVAQWMLALCLANRLSSSAHTWLTELMSRVVLAERQAVES